MRLRNMKSRHVGCGHQPMESKVPRYHFNLKSKESKIPDDSGQDLSSTWHAYMRAQEIIRQCIQYTDIQEDEQWMIDITNDVGEAQIVVLFPRAMPATSVGCEGS
jgi:hypothetical protein